MRALLGIIFFVQIFVLMFFPEWIKDYISNLEYANAYESGRSLYFFENKGFFYFVSLVLFLKGCHLLWTSKYHGFIVQWNAWTYSGDSGTGQYQNIDRVKAYRNSAMNLMTSEDAAKEFKQTAWLDGVDSCSGENAERAKKYINSTLSLKDNESALKWLKEK